MAKTELFQRIENYRRRSGRNPKNGFRGKMPKEFDDVQLIIIALRLASRVSARTDLRPRYAELAKELEEAVKGAGACHEK